MPRNGSGKFGNVKTVEWLDDSSLNVVFDDPVCVNRAVEGLRVQSASCSECSTASDVEVGQDWVRTKPLKGRDGVVPVELRACTVADVKSLEHDGNTDSVFYSLEKEKQKLRNEGFKIRKDGTVLPSAQHRMVQKNADTVPFVDDFPSSASRSALPRVVEQSSAKKTDKTVSYASSEFHRAGNGT